MEFPVEVEEVKSIFSMAKSTVDVIIRLCRRFKEPDDDESGEDGDREDCIREAILILHKETQAKKSSHVEKFVENTLLNPACELKPSTIFFLLKDIEQMTWRQLCLLEGVRRRDSNSIEIIGYNDSGINGISIGIEIEKLVNLNYLNVRSNSEKYASRDVNHVWMSDLGHEISNLLDLQSIKISELSKAFGKGRIRTETIY